MNLRLFVDLPLQAGSELALPAAAARHAQVLRVQPGDGLWLFDGTGPQWPATVLGMSRSEVRVRVGDAQVVHKELPLPITLALAMPANERMDGLVEKATELGVAAVQPLHSERSVLRLSGERAQRKQAHWQGIAQAACEQSGRARLPQVHAVQNLLPWLAGAAAFEQRLLLSLRGDARPLPALPSVASGALVLLSGPEGGLTAQEEDAARAAGFAPISLGARVLRADTAPLAALAWLSVQALSPNGG